MYLGSPDAVSPSYVPQYQEDLHKSLEEMQKTQIEHLSMDHPSLKIATVVVDGRAVQVIKEASQDCDLIVMGHRGLGGILSWVLGSVAKQMVDSCTAPVLVVKNPDYC